MKYDNQLRYALQILDEFQNQMPLNAWLRNFFRLHKQMGSSDRKQISAMLYSYYRLGHAQQDIPKDERILLGLYLCNHEPNELLDHFKSEWNSQIHLPVEQKISSLNPEEIFPWKEQLSEGIDHKRLCLSFLQQPDLFIRIRPGREDFVVQKLTEQGWPFEKISGRTIRLDNGVKIENLFRINADVVIQDLNSQRVAEFFPGIHETASDSGNRINVWDCCAGSGGKTILLSDYLPGIRITVSDIRESILANLKIRLGQADIHEFNSQVADLSDSKSSIRIFGSPFDMILADAPCSGSGTWSRNPESLYFFDPKKIETFYQLQKKILTNILPHLISRGQLIYVTCSVFRKENEEIANFIKDQFGMHVVSQNLLGGYSQRADSLFVAKAKF
ncbi:MAG: Fmu (Sun) domain-containing protein [Chitinophagales bacterium]